MCDSAPHCVTPIAPGKKQKKKILVACKQTLYSELYDSSVCSSHREQPRPPSPPPGHGACWSALDHEQNWEVSDQQPMLMKPSLLHSFPPFLLAPQLKLTLFMDHGTLLSDLPGQEQETLERTGHLTSTYRCQFGNVFFVSASVTFAVCCLLWGEKHAALFPRYLVFVQCP